MGYRISGALITCCIVWLVMAFVYPDQLVTKSTRFMNLMDTEINYENTFTVASQIARGHIDVFNVFDGFGFAYGQLSVGVYTFTNICVAIIYLVFSHFVDDKAQFFHQCYSVMFFSINLMLRVLGSYLLASLFTKRLLVIIISSVYLNVIMMQYLMNNGMMVNNLFSYMPLLLFFMIRAVDRLSWRDALMVMLVLSVSINNGILGALGYYYLVIHPLLLGCLWWLLIVKRQQFFEALQLLWTREFWVRHRSFTIFMGVLIILLLLPLACWANELVHQFYIANSGLGGTAGRLSNIFNIHQYFNFPGRSYTDPSMLLQGLVDYRFPAWGWSWPWVSAGCLVFACLGVALMRHWSITLCLLSITWIIFLNIPAHDGMGIEGFAHWINVLTNPFQFLVRSFHMANLLAVSLLLPLVIVGLDGLMAFANREQWAIKRWRHMLGVTALLLVPCLMMLPNELRIYVGIIVSLILMAAVFTAFKGKLRLIAGVCLLAVIMIDLSAAKHYVVGDLMKDRALIKDDWRAPGELTWQDHYRQDYHQLEPKRYGYLNTFGFYYGFYPMVERFTRPVSLYEPRHIIFKDLPIDQEGVAYLLRENRLFFLAENAVSSDDVSLGALLAQGLDRRVALIKWPADKAIGIASPKEVSLPPLATAAINIDQKEFHADSLIAQLNVNQPGWVIMHWPFDKQWQLTIDGVKQKLYLANKYFLGFPISQGKHSIKLVYAPHHPLRVLVWFMMVAIILSVIVLFKEGYRDHRSI